MKKITVSIGFCVAVLVIFILSVAMSRDGLPVGLRDMYGDTSGIHRLTIEGMVDQSWHGQYGYSFRICRDEGGTDIAMLNNSGAFVDFTRNYAVHPFSVWHWNRHFFYRPTFIPTEPYEIIRTYSETSFIRHHGGDLIPMPEYRIYNEVFIVEPSFHGFRLQLEGAAPVLYIDAGRDGFIFANDENTQIHHFSPGFGFHSTLNLRLLDQLRIDDVSVFVPTGTNMFGQTAVYIAVGYGERFYGDTEYISAEILFPIELERGRDEIVGLIEHGEDVLLLIIRGDGFEIARINVFTGDYTALFIDEFVHFNEYFISGDSLVFTGLQFNHEPTVMANQTIIRSFDLSDGGLRFSAGFTVSLGEVHTDGWWVLHDQIFDILYRDGFLYIAYTLEPSFAMAANTIRTFVSAFDTQGRLIGRSQVLNGVEDDMVFMWDSRFGTVSTDARRRLAIMSIR